MTSRQHGMARERRNQHRRPRPLGAIADQQQDDDRMDYGDVAANPQKVHAGSDYGSDVDLIHITASSDYGSDIDLDAIEEGPVTGHVPSQPATSTAKIIIYPSVELQGVLEGRHEAPALAPSQPALRCAYSSPPQRKKSPVEVEYEASSRRAFSVPKEDSTSLQINDVLSEQTLPTKNDSRTPLQRFRARRPLSVTDLISPAWCELQYWYTLSKFGRKPATRAMKAGTKIHHALEEEVHTIVPVRVNTKEDRFGLRIWNTVQGLRCLRETGLTRELEVWGIIEGQVINGVIDELSLTCPDRELEDNIDLSKTAKSGGTLPLGQLSIEHAFSKAGTSALHANNSDAWIGDLELDRRIYIADVKTRGVRTIPKGASLRPTRMQLMLYRKLLESLSLNTVDAETVLRRYNLLPLEPFSDSFMLAVGDQSDTQNNQPDLNTSSISDREEIRAHPNLLSLWSLMIQEFQQVGKSIGDILRVEFRYSKTGDVIGSELIVYDPEEVDAYSEDEIRWWEGHREAKGVEIEDAFKCRICDFAEICTWRKAKIEEATEKNRLARRARGRSAV